MTELLNTKISIIIPTYNEELCIQRCIRTILDQSYPGFELIIVNDCSTDNTEKIINGIMDNRIVYLKNSRRMGIAYSRNIGIRNATTEYIFFADADCMPSKFWLQEGIKELKKGDCLGVEGKTYYETSRTSITDDIIENLKGGEYITCNIAYRKKILEEVGYFNENYKLVNEDTDLAQKVLKKGAIKFVPDMVVIHQQKKLTVQDFFQDAIKVFSQIKYIKDTKDYRGCFCRIMHPQHFIFILLPPLLFLRYRFISLKELFLVPVLYLSYVFERILIWTAAIKERIFIL